MIRIPLNLMIIGKQPWEHHSFGIPYIQFSEGISFGKECEFSGEMLGAI